MDLPTCPACGQSVLDDDAQECPFCGSPMKGGAPPKGAIAKLPPKATKKMALPPAAEAPPASAKPAPAVSKPKPAPARSPDDNPMEVDEKAVASAILTSPRPDKNRTYEVTCPMCETKGYVSPRASGQTVRCCNKECLVPIFTAPVIQKEAPPPPPPPPRSYTGIFLGGSVALVAIAAGAVFWYMESNSQMQNLKVEATPIYVPKKIDTPDPAVEKNAKDVAAKKASAPPPKVVKTNAAIIEASFPRLLNAAREASPPRKPFCRRVAAIDYAELGNLKDAEDQLEQLSKVGRSTKYEAILPLVAIAWQQSSPHAAAELTKTIDRASALAKQLPTRGRLAIESSTALAAALASVGRHEEARKLLAPHQNPAGLVEYRLVAALQVVREDRSFDLDTPITGRALGDWQFPLEAAVTLTLIAHDRWNESLAWAKQLPEVPARTECVTLWAERFAENALATTPPQEIAKATEAAADLSPENRARLLARLAEVKFEKGDQAGAGALVKQAKADLKPLMPHAALPIADMKELMQLQTPDQYPLRATALAWAEVAGVEVLLGQRDDAWTDFKTSLAFFRGLAPNLVVVEKFQKDMKRNGDAVTREALTQALGLKTPDEARRALNQFKSQCDALQKLATSRFQDETMLLMAAANLGLLDQVAEEIQAAAVKPDPNEQEQFLNTGLGIILAARFAAAGQAEKAAAFENAIKDHGELPDELPGLRESTVKLLDQGDVDRIAQQLNSSIDKTGAVDEWALRIACRLVKTDRIPLALKLLGGLKDVLLREDGLRLTGALSAVLGKGESFLEASKSLALTPTETVATYGGVIEGLANLPPPAPTPAVAPGTDTESAAAK